MDDTTRKGRGRSTGEREVIVQRSKINRRIDQRSTENTLNARLLKDINGFSGETRTTSYILKWEWMKGGKRGRGRYLE